jgi:endoglucanase
MNWNSRILACVIATATQCIVVVAYAEQTPSPRLTEIRTAASDILVACFKSAELGAIETESSNWRLNEQPPLEVSKWVTPKWDEVEFAYEHRIYLRFRDAFVQGRQYVLTSSHGAATFVFDDAQVYCESIKTNQSAYSALSTTRFANFAIWTANGKVERLPGPLPPYGVVEVESGKEIAEGVLKEVGPCENAGDFVYRIDLSDVPAGGPYKIVIRGIGCSFPFGVGGAFSDRLAYVAFRGLLYERCGMEQKAPYFEHDIREACHTRVYVTDSQPREAKIDISAEDPIITVHGGYHDAGDCDRRDHHMMAPICLLSMYDAFPHYFTDGQYNIPDKFDEQYVPTGKGNGIPDIIDEAAWGTLVFEYLQDEGGGVRSGIERNGYPEDGPTVDKDNANYGTFRVSAQSTCLAAGLFAHLARALKPHDSVRSEKLRQRAEKAWRFAGDQAGPAHKLYYYTQHYLLTGDKTSHQRLIENASVAQAYLESHEDNPRSIHKGEVVFGALFASYLLDEQRDKNSRVTRIFEESIRKTADKRVAELQANPYPNGTRNPNRWWGSQTAQGQYAEPCILQWRLSGEQKYIDAASVLMDYNQGLNPVGKCYLTGIGFDRTWDPLHHDSYPMKAQGWGPAPGLQVFGPGNLRHIKSNALTVFPDVHTLPKQRQFVDNRRYVSVTEFTIPESLAFPSAIYTVLAEGSEWDGATDPYKFQGLPFVFRGK